MKVLVGCEFSQTVTKAFRDSGHEAYSCDIVPCEINPDWHIQGDVLEILDRDWDLAIFHPPCTYLTVTGNKWFYHPDDKDLPLTERRAHPRFPNRWKDREDGVKFFTALYNANIPRIAVENPVGVMSTILRKPDQIIQPWQFGHEASKSTCLWLKNLPKLEPTNIVSKGEFVTYKSGKRMTKWYADAASLSPEEREKVRNRTFQGIADAMVSQWGNIS